MSFTLQSIGFQYRHKETNPGCVNHGEWGTWAICDQTKANQMQEYIDQGYPYALREIFIKVETPHDD